MRPARTVAALLGVVALATPLTAFAQQTPAAPAPPPPAPSYARPAVNGEETIQGRIASFDGKYHVQLRDDRGYVDNIELHQGTVINPTGLSLQPGMTVTIMGYNRGPVFAANEIDTPYLSYGALPLYPAYSVGIGFGPVDRHHW
jgi:hypothetical protein